MASYKVLKKENSSIGEIKNAPFLKKKRCGEDIQEKQIN